MDFNVFFSFRLSSDGQDFFTPYDEVYESFDAMGLQENLLRGIYAYGNLIYFFSVLLFLLTLFNPLVIAIGVSFFFYDEATNVVLELYYLLSMVPKTIKLFK